MSTNSTQKFSMLSNISEIYHINHRFEFILDYPESGNWFWWRQTNNPIYELEVSGVNQAEGFESIYISSTPTRSFGGLVRTTLRMDNEDKVNSFLDGNPGVANWHFAIGAYSWTPYPWRDNGFPPHDTSYAKIVKLWLRIHPHIVDHCSFTTQKRNVFLISICLSIIS